MDKKQLRDGLMAQLWRMYSMDIMLYLREFLVGETALLECIASSGRTLTPGEISEKMHLSRARTANILRTLREKGFITMEVAGDDRRKMLVTMTVRTLRANTPIWSAISTNTSTCSAKKTYPISPPF